ncbi:hypothetical protein BDZ94DRAFT_1325460 [Collybia nuda]|uniref:BTB domain-containing protein n=1 Tax=Collybia nuda TaxID=64659 RepID=A0A9P6CEZ2_9AGAR|nr:hypothetical protein BDZ94DRAFT_1325460 [Collybia nuda]
MPWEQCSEQFNSTDADITFKSCDNVLFKIHQKNLETSTGGFAPAGFETLDELVPLTETSSTLELLFQYIYPMPQPDIRSLPFDTVAAVAEAAEKYQVYAAIYNCALVMEMTLPDYAHTIFIHGGRHGHKFLLGKAAPYLIGMPLDEMVSELPGHLIVPWIKYHMTWQNILHEARSYPYKNDIQFWEKYPQIVMKHMSELEDVKDLKDLTAVSERIKIDGGFSISAYLLSWRNTIESNIERMKSFDWTRNDF